MAFTAKIDLDNTMMGPHTINTLDTITIGGSPTYTISGSGASGTTMLPGSVLTNNGWAPNPNTTMSISQSGTIQLEGKNADIRVNGESMMETLRGIQNRLNMLRPNTELEAEWDQLRELGEQYRKLEAEFEEKSKMWNTLKK
jgi:hypothetical protein